LSDHPENPHNSANDDTAEYLQVFLDETEEQLDDLTETMLALERNPESLDELNEAFRLVHTIKGSAGMMGLDNIALLSHHLESCFERYRSRTGKLDRGGMDVALRCIDYLRDANNRLRAGEELQSAADLLDELGSLESRMDEPAEVDATSKPADSEGPVDRPDLETESPDLDVVDATAESQSPPVDEGDEIDQEGLRRLIVSFEPGLQLADLKAQLIVSRLSALGDIRSTRPPVDELENVEELLQFEVEIRTEQAVDDLRAAGDVDGVQSIEFVSAQSGTTASEDADGDTQIDESIRPDEPRPSAAQESEGEQFPTDSMDLITPAVEDVDPGGETAPETSEEIPETVMEQTVGEGTEPPVRSGSERPQHPAGPPESSPTQLPAGDRAPARAAETMRVDIGRLDHLMNLAGELVVNRAQFVQIASDLNPALRKSTVIDRAGDFTENLRRAIEGLQNQNDDAGELSGHIQELEAGLELMEEQARVWQSSRRHFGQINEAIDQLTRVSDSLQRGVLETRMVPVGPLFNRFKRVVRDLSVDRGKKVNLVIRGQKTELDKRMIDELGDPLVHLVRNSIDHGLERPELREQRGKPEVGTIVLDASHSGNTVHIRISDDGGGIDAAKIRTRLVERGILPADTVDELTDDQIVNYIWLPGMSTAQQITDVSGRGVGMDVVKTRIGDLNGVVEVFSKPGEGTTFAIRLPLTLAIINSLLVRIRQVVFSIPIDDVREIVSVRSQEIVAVHGRQTFEVRSEFLPLVHIDDVFQWHDVAYGYRSCERERDVDQSSESIEVVVLHAGGKTLGLRVDELLGSQDIVIKSLSENFIDIRGLSGASILGDGTVCLMIDAATVIDMAVSAPHGSSTDKERSIVRPR
jgi:two-component system chemotaxis sensor kinase CheA